MRMFDVHSHLQDERLLGRLDSVIARAHQAGVERMVCCGCTEQDWEHVRRIARTHPPVIASYALHPLYLRNRTRDWLDRLRAYASEPGAVIGETGLDHLVDGADPVEQESVCTEHLRLASQLNRPVSIHCRKAWGRMLELLREHADFDAGVHIHSFSGSVETLDAVCAMGARVSWSGAVTQPRNRRGQAAVQAVALDRLLLETDSPDLPPDGTAREAPNEPANLPIVLRCVAGIRGLPADELAAIVWANSCRFFRQSEAP